MFQNWSWKQFFKTSFLYVLFIMSIVGGFIGWYVVSTVFTVQNIIVQQGNNPISLIGAESLKGENILFLKEDVHEKVLLAQNPLLNDITIQKQFPDTVNITLKQRVPVAYLQGDVGWFLLDKTGRILQKVRKTEKKLPLITSYQKLNFVLYQAGNIISFQEISLTLRFIQKAQSLEIPIESVDISGFHMIRLISKDKTLLISAEKDPATQEYQLETMVRELRIEGKDFKTLDLRFEKPIFEAAEKK